MGVDVIEAGFAIASEGDFRAVHEIAKKVKDSVVCSGPRRPRRHRPRRRGARARSQKAHPHLHRDQPAAHAVKLQKTPEQVHEAVIDSVTHARRYCDDVEWSCEDGSRSEHDFLCRCVESAIAAGAGTVNIPDTVGYAYPEEFADLIRMIRNRVPNIDKAVISVHCHNDLGLGVANSLRAIEAGARQVECTINGIGERAGNAAMEEIVMALRTRHDLLPYQTRIVTQHITRASRLVSAITGSRSSRTRRSSAPMRSPTRRASIRTACSRTRAPTRSCGPKTSVWSAPAWSWASTPAARLPQEARGSGLRARRQRADRCVRPVQGAGRQEEGNFDEDLIALVDDEIQAADPHIKVLDLDVHCGSRPKSLAAIVLEVGGQRREAQAQGDGPVDATFNAIKQLVPHTATLALFQIHA